MYLAPVAPPLDRYRKGDRHSQYPFHFFLDHVFRFFAFVIRDLQDQFVMDLHDHLCLEAFIPYASVDPDHGYLDEIGSGPLDGGIYGRPLRKLSGSAIGAADLGEVSAPILAGSDL